MRLLDLHLKAFGPFTDHRLDLSGGTEGLHVVFGPNEAGKSSALRAIKALLYGFHPRSVDNFVHAHEDLRVGGRLRHSDGTEYAFVRRKGTKSTVLGPDETPLDDGFLDRCLQGMEEKLFSSLFGIDHDSLIAGGKELLEQHGDVGQALFAAGLGTRNLRKVLQALDAEAEELFTPTAKKRQINLDLARLQETRKIIQDTSLSGRRFEDLHRELEKKREESDALGREIAGLERERHRLERIRRVLRLLPERRHLKARLAELGDAIILPADFPERRRQTEEALRTARESRDRAAVELAELREEAAALTVAGPVLAQAETIERLHQGIELFAKGLRDRSRLVGESGELRGQAEELLEEIRPGMTLDEAEALRPALDRWVRIQQLANQRQALVNDLDQKSRAVEEAEGDLDALRETLAALPAPRDPATLRRAAEAARRAGKLDDLAAETGAALARDEEQLRIDLGRLGLWTGTPEELEALPVPPSETLERFAADFAALAQRRDALEDRRRTAATELANTERRLEEIRRAGAVPTEEELAAARERRDRGWAGLRKAWNDVQADAYERTVEEADDLADRLRREAGRVQMQATLLAQRHQRAAEIADLDRERAEADREGERLAAAWKDLWRPCGIDPLPPREMHPAWTSRHEKLRAKAEAVRALRRKATDIARTVRDHREALAAELERPAPTPGSLLEPVLVRSEEVVRRLEDEERRRIQSEQGLRDAEARLARSQRDEETADAALEAWRAAWADAIRGLGLGGDALPAEVIQLVDTLRKIAESRRDAAKVDHRIAGLDRDLEAFRADARALAALLAPERVDQPADQTAVHLHALLRDARRQADRRAALERRLEKLEREVRDAEATRRAMEERLEHLRAEAGSPDDAGLEDAERRSAEVLDLRRDLDRCERQLREEGEGATLEDLEKEAEGVDADALPGRIGQLEGDVEEKKKRLGDLREALGREQQDLDHQTGGDAAAQAAEKAQEILARLSDGVGRYVRLRLAGTRLRREIERYRAENQAPLLSRAGDLFTELTLGRFTGLQTDFNHQDEPVLVGTRAGGQKVRVEGMSDGTRDQLYLALRLATLEGYLKRAEPLPFIVDDILINFDDERSAATLKVLAELSKQTQVILFTHHERLKEMAGGMRNGAGVFVREIS